MFGHLQPHRAGERARKTERRIEHPWLPEPCLSDGSLTKVGGILQKETYFLHFIRNRHLKSFFPDRVVRMFDDPCSRPVPCILQHDHAAMRLVTMKAENAQYDAHLNPELVRILIWQSRMKKAPHFTFKDTLYEGPL